MIKTKLKTNTNVKWKNVKVNLKKDSGKKQANPPKGSFSKKFSDKWTEYYEDAFDQYKDKSKAAKVAWSRIKHRYEKSDKSGKWILKKTKKLNKKSR